MSYMEKGHYTGEYKEGWYHGKGTFLFENGVKYVGFFDKGEFHGSGTLHYPGQGQFKGEWENGQLVTGEYVFPDGLRFEKEEKWRYCTYEDRRFYHEKVEKSSSEVEVQRERLFKEIPEGCYGQFLKRHG